MRLLLFEPNHRGHHFVYLARLLPGMLRLPVKITVGTTPEALESREYKLSLIKHEDRLDWWTGCRLPTGHPLKKAARRARELRAALRDVKPDYVGLIYGDGLWQILTLLSLVGVRLIPRSMPAEAWLYRGGFAYDDATSLPHRLRRWLFARLLRKGIFRTLYLDDELLLRFAESIKGSKTRLVLTPNPIDFLPEKSRADARAELGLPADGRLISSSGMVSPWKGMDRLIHNFVAAAGDGRLRDTDRLLLAGPHSEEIVALLTSDDVKPWVASGRILSRDEFLSEAQMFAVAAASDLVVAGYPQHSGRSSIILWAAAAGRPVLAAARGCIGYVVHQENLGATADVNDPAAFTRAMVDALDAPWTPADAERVRAYAHWHRIENYQHVGATLLRQLTDSPAPGDAAEAPSAG
ncbi:MAG: glycosyltransferase [Planctomycetota bacterium]